MRNISHSPFAMEIRYEVVCKRQTKRHTRDFAQTCATQPQVTKVRKAGTTKQHFHCFIFLTLIVMNHLYYCGCLLVVRSPFFFFLLPLPVLLGRMLLTFPSNPQVTTAISSLLDVPAFSYNYFHLIRCVIINSYFFVTHIAFCIWTLICRSIVCTSSEFIIIIFPFACDIHNSAFQIC